MARDLLLTAHHGHALAGACDLGCWQPLPLRLDDVLDLTHLAVLEPGAQAITAVAEIVQIEPWLMADGAEHWLPLLGLRRQLRRPVRLGSSRLLQGWLPRGPRELRLLSIDGLLASGSVAAYLRLLSKGQTADRCAGDPWL